MRIKQAILAAPVRVGEEIPNTEVTLFYIQGPAEVFEIRTQDVTDAYHKASGMGRKARADHFNFNRMLIPTEEWRKGRRA